MEQLGKSGVNGSDIYWVINQNTYNVDGIVPKGRMLKNE
jgi:hypothetical protein